MRTLPACAPRHAQRPTLPYSVPTYLSTAPARSGHPPFFAHGGEDVCLGRDDLSPSDRKTRTTQPWSRDSPTSASHGAGARMWNSEYATRSNGPSALANTGSGIYVDPSRSANAAEVGRRMTE